MCGTDAGRSADQSAKAEKGERATSVLQLRSQGTFCDTVPKKGDVCGDCECLFQTARCCRHHRQRRITRRSLRSIGHQALHIFSTSRTENQPRHRINQVTAHAENPKTQSTSSTNERNCRIWKNGISGTMPNKALLGVCDGFFSATSRTQRAATFKK